MFFLSANFLLQLDNRVPRWRYMVILRLITIIVSLATIACFTVVCSGTTSKPSDSTGWQWGNLFLESFTFLPSGISVVWAAEILIYLAVMKRPVNPIVCFGADLTVLVINMLPISFCFSVDGPMQSVQASSMADPETLDGNWEIAGVIGLLILGFLHLGFMVWDVRAMGNHKRAKRAVSMPPRPPTEQDCWHINQRWPKYVIDAWKLNTTSLTYADTSQHGPTLGDDFHSGWYEPRRQDFQ